MNTLAVVLALLLFITLVILVLHFLTSNTLHTALGSLLALLGTLIAAMVAPSAEGEANVNLSFGSLGNVTAHWLKVNTSTPKDIWYMAFITIGILTFVTLNLVKDSSKPKS